MASMFASAKKVSTTKAKAKKEKTQIEIDGLLTLAAIDSLIKKLTAVKATMDSDIKSQMSVEFVRIGAATKSRPENFEGINGLSSASCELRARSSASALSDDEEELMNEANLPVETVTSTVESYIINPEFFNDQTVLSKVEKALSKIAGLPESFIMKQDGVSKKIVGAGALDMLFATGDKDKIAELLPLVSTLAIKPKLDEKADAFEIVKDILALGEKEAA